MRLLVYVAKNRFCDVIIKNFFCLPVFRYWRYDVIKSEEMIIDGKRQSWTFDKEHCIIILCNGVEITLTIFRS